MSTMNAITVNIGGDAPAVRPFALMRGRVLPALERKRGDLDAMYAPVMGRPEVDPVRLMAVTALQIMQRLPDRACAEACLYDARWRLALGDIPDFHPTTLVNFRNRLAESGKARFALETCRDAISATRTESALFSALSASISFIASIKACPFPHSSRSMSDSMAEA